MSYSTKKQKAKLRSNLKNKSIRGFTHIILIPYGSLEQVTIFLSFFENDGIFLSLAKFVVNYYPKIFRSPWTFSPLFSISFLFEFNVHTRKVEFISLQCILLLFFSPFLGLLLRVKTRISGSNFYSQQTNLSGGSENPRQYLQL